MSNKEFRPEKLDDLFGQDHLKPTLNKWLAEPNEIPQALLLHGPYGCSKTSIARMLSKVLTTNEEDIHEMNAAASRGIDDVRDIADNANFSGFGGNKVYIIDEFHQMTTAAQSALLKVIEDPRDGIYFIFCTTEYAKLLNTIRSRCTQLEVKLLSENDAFALMDKIGTNLDEQMKAAIYFSSGGHARDIVKALAIGASNPQVIEQAGNNIMQAQELVQNWFIGEDSTINPWLLLNADEAFFRMLCDWVCDNPSVLRTYLTESRYNNLLSQRANSVLFLISQKQRYIHMISLRY